MQLPIVLRFKLNWFCASICFFKSNFLKIISLALIAAFGRVIQLGGFGEITWLTNVLLEVATETSRLIIFFYALGLGNTGDGIFKVRRFFTDYYNRKLVWRVATQRLKKYPPSIFLNLVVFLLSAWAVNYLIDLAAYETCLYLTLQRDGILSSSSSEWTILLFFKNLSVIPFTMVFNAVFFLWITNKFRFSKTFKVIE